MEALVACVIVSAMCTGFMVVFDSLFMLHLDIPAFGFPAMFATSIIMGASYENGMIPSIVHMHTNSTAQHVASGSHSSYSEYEWSEIGKVLFKGVGSCMWLE